jgi:hypothetical protein
VEHASILSKNTLFIHGNMCANRFQYIGAYSTSSMTRVCHSLSPYYCGLLNVSKVGSLRSPLGSVRATGQLGGSWIPRPAVRQIQLLLTPRLFKDVEHYHSKRQALSLSLLVTLPTASLVQRKEKHSHSGKAV